MSKKFFLLGVRSEINHFDIVQIYIGIIIQLRNVRSISSSARTCDHAEYRRVGAPVAPFTDALPTRYHNTLSGAEGWGVQPAVNLLSPFFMQICTREGADMRIPPLFDL